MEIIEIGDLLIEVTRKPIKNVHLTVHPPDGRVSLAAPPAIPPEVVRAYAISRLGWIRDKQARFQSQAREKPRQFITRESHYLWGKRYLLSVSERDAKPAVTMNHRQIHLAVRPGSDREKRAQVMHAWHKSQLHAFVQPSIQKWEVNLGVTVSRYFLQRMKTRWGSCNPARAHIRLNTELVKKPKDLVEYVIVHELLHLLEPTHNPRFVHLLNLHLPGWREARAELNDLPLANANRDL
ncbi:MAG: SprT family zinc-dependent metalloprotease [Pseudomonadales bacterium]